MTNKKMIEILKELWRYSKTNKYTDAEIREAFDMAIEVLEQQPCEDAISRKDVLSLFNKSDDYRWETTWIRRKIEKLPSVTPSIYDLTEGR